MPDAVRLEHRLARLDLLVVELLEVDGATLAREGVGVAQHAHDVVVPGERPEAVVRGILVVPVHRIARAQFVERGPWVAVLEEVEVGQADLRR